MWSAVRDSRGFTLVELLVVTAVLGLVLSGIVVMQTQGQQAYLFGAHRVEVQQNARVALDLMVRELRSAQSITALTSATDLAFVDQNGVALEYSISGTTLNRIASGTATPLVGGVQTFSLTYYSAFDASTNTGTTTTDPVKVTSIVIQLVTGTEDQVSAGSPSDQHATMASMVRLRNM